MCTEIESACKGSGRECVFRERGKQIFQQLSLKNLKCSRETERLCVCVSVQRERERDGKCVQREGRSTF